MGKREVAPPLNLMRDVPRHGSFVRLVCDRFDRKNGRVFVLREPSSNAFSLLNIHPVLPGKGVELLSTLRARRCDFGHIGSLSLSLSHELEVLPPGQRFVKDISASASPGDIAYCGSKEVRKERLSH